MSKNKYKDSVNKIKFKDSFDEDAVNAMLDAASERKKKRKARIFAISSAAVACAAAVVVLLVSLPKNSVPDAVMSDLPAPAVEIEIPLETEPVKKGTSLILSINPDIEFTVDENDMIISVAGLNEDGAALIEGLDFTGYSFENAAVLVVNKLIENNYISVTDAEKVITLSLSGENRRSSLIEDMSAIIKAAAEPYEISVDTVSSSEDVLDIKLIAPKPIEEESILPDADPNDLPDYLQIDFDLTGKVNGPDDIGLNADGVFMSGYTEVSDVYITIEGVGKFRASEIVEFDTAGDWLRTSVFQVMHSLIDKGYIANNIPGKVTLSFSGCTDEQYALCEQICSLMLEEAELALKVMGGDDGLSIVPSGEPVKPQNAVYSMSELLDQKINKDREKITDLQIKVLTLSYTEYIAEEKIKNRQWAVIPDFYGMDEKAAEALCIECGFVPRLNYEDIAWFEPREQYESLIGKVIYQDCTEGFTMTTGMPIMINVLKEFEKEKNKVPNLYGMDEQAAVDLCYELGFGPTVVYDDIEWYPVEERERLKELIGKVVYQDLTEGMILERGTPITINIMKD